MQNKTNLPPTSKRGTTVSDVADFTGLSRPTVYKAIRRCELRAKKVGKRTVILPVWVDEWLNALPDTRELLL